MRRFDPVPRNVNIPNLTSHVVQALDGKDRRTLVSRGADPRLRTGQLLYIRDETLLAVPFDIVRLAVTGGPVPIAESVSGAGATLAGQFAVSSQGTVVWTTGTGTGGTKKTLVWVDRQGHEEPIHAPTRDYGNLRLSPDGTKLAIEIRDQEYDIWVFDLAKELLTRLTFNISPGQPLGVAIRKD